MQMLLCHVTVAHEPVHRAWVEPGRHPQARLRVNSIALPRPRLQAYNARFHFTIEEHNIMEAERTNALSALLADLTIREAELRRYL